MAGLSRDAKPTPPAVAAASPPRGQILHDQLEARVLPRIVGPLGPGNLQYVEMWKTAQRQTQRSVKFGTIMPELLAAAVADDYYKDPVERCWAFSEALNQELNLLADAGCPVIQLEEPQIHMVPARGKTFGRLDTGELVKLFNNTVKGLRQKTEVWCHTCWGNPAQQRIFRVIQSYQPTLAALNEIDAGAITFETCSSGTGDLAAIGATITEKKVVVGVIDHHTLQIERPDQVAALIREALRHIPAERLVISSDCGMGREGMSRRHAQYKMVAMVLGTNVVRKESGVPEADCLAADPRFRWLRRPEPSGRIRSGSRRGAAAAFRQRCCCTRAGFIVTNLRARAMLVPSSFGARRRCLAEPVHATTLQANRHAAYRSRANFHFRGWRLPSRLRCLRTLRRRRSSRWRTRADHRDAGGARTADRDGRGARRHQFLAR